MPRLENWYQYSGSLVGQVYDDELGRFEDGEIMITSTLKVLNREEKYCDTLNNRYTLGNEIKPPMEGSFVIDHSEDMFKENERLRTENWRYKQLLYNIEKKCSTMRATYQKGSYPDTFALSIIATEILTLIEQGKEFIKKT